MNIQQLYNNLSDLNSRVSRYFSQRLKGSDQGLTQRMGGVTNHTDNTNGKNLQSVQHTMSMTGAMIRHITAYLIAEQRCSAIIRS